MALFEALADSCIDFMDLLLDNFGSLGASGGSIEVATAKAPTISWLS